MIQRTRVLIAILLFFSFSSEPHDREAVGLLKDYLKIDTTNPPGGEIAAARFFAAICAREGIEHRIFEPLTGRGTIWARVKGDGSKRPLILLNHTDVVPHSREFWTVDPFAAVEKDEFIYGRGAMDMKSLGIAQFISLLAINREMKSRGVAPSRDLIFLATADEESGGVHGAGWFAREQRALLANAEFLLNEGGSNLVDKSGEVRAIGVGPSEKTPVWLRLIATGPAGHASIPNPESAANRLIRALGKLQNYRPPFQVTPVVEQSFRAMAPLSSPQLREKFERIKDAVNDPAFVREMEKDPPLLALLRNTISITVFSASNKTNVISPSASAEVDTRIVPGDSVDRWINEVKGVIADDSIRIERILAFEANASPIDSELVRNVEALIKDKFPGARMIYPVLAGFTDCHYFRDLGVASYGFSPFVAKPHLAGSGYHGNDERIGSQAFIEGVRLYRELVARMVK
jgi:acetylornithine deacetylase/succinyl-diaminopimelate desuccinylase-like protein